MCRGGVYLGRDGRASRVETRPRGLTRSTPQTADGRKLSYVRGIDIAGKIKGGFIDE